MRRFPNTPRTRTWAVSLAAAAVATAALVDVAHTQTIPATVPATLPATVPATVPATPPARPARPAPITAADITDEQVLASMRKGVEYLLGQLKDKDNWETKFDAQGKALRTKQQVVKGVATTVPDTWPGDNFGGETAAALYALLHVGSSVRDDADLGERLKFNSKELEPVVRWLSNLRAEATYTAGLQSSALGLLKKETELGKAAQVGMKFAYGFLITAMDEDGGYHYSGPRARPDAGVYASMTAAEVWQRYVEALSKKDAATADAGLKSLTYLASQVARKAGGVRALVDVITQDIQVREAQAIAKKDAAGQRLAQLERRELQSVTGALVAAASKVKDPAVTALETAQRRLTEAVQARNTGNVIKKDANGRQMKDSKNQPIMVRGVPEEIAKELADAQAAVANAQKAAVRAFTPTGDLSNAQYGTLGVWAQSDAEIEIPIAYWQTADRFWRLTQRADGSWPYSARGEYPTADGKVQQRPSMALAGVASLAITSAMLDTQVRLDPKPDKELEAGIAWVNANFKATHFDGYYLYGVERVGLATGLKYFNQADWYRVGARTILAAQKPDGSWIDHGSPIVGTSYALLFLARGRNPILFNKLEYAGPWNARPRDNANLTEWISKKFERPINWQTVNLKVAGEEWSDAPILMITGSKALSLAPEDVARIRAFINTGGMVFSTADGNRAEFTDSIKKLAAQVVEDGGKARYEMRELPADHVLFSPRGNELYSPPARPQRILGMSNGVREIWVHSPHDMGATYQARRTKEGGDDYIFATNLYRYVSGKLPLRTKLQTLAVNVGKETPTKTIALGRLDYAGNWDPEPGAWPRLGKLLQRDAKTGVKVNTVKFTELDPKTTPVVHMTGTTGFAVNGDDAALLKKYLEGGGTLIADAAGGSTAFRDSFEGLIRAALGARDFAQVPTTSKLLNGTVPGSVNATQVEFRRSFLQTVRGAGNEPRVRGIQIDGRYAVLFSEVDITSGLLGTNTWGIMGYAPESAANLARNMVLYAADPKAGKDGPPAAEAASGK